MAKLVGLLADFDEKVADLYKWKLKVEQACKEIQHFSLEQKTR